MPPAFPRGPNDTAGSSPPPESPAVTSGDASQPDTSANTTAASWVSETMRNAVTLVTAGTVGIGCDIDGPDHTALP